MAREIDADFLQLTDFLKSYRLDGIEQKPDQLKVVRAAHKAYLPFLQFWAICLDKAGRGAFQFLGKGITSESPELPFLRETVSDTGSGLFCCLHGAYKPGHMALRSAIENFLRFASAPFDPSALTTTSVYDLFDLAKATPSFADSRKAYLSQLRSCYVSLCKFSHSATLSHMAGIHALAHFPSFDAKAFQGWLELANACMCCIATVTVICAPLIYLDSHFAAREMLDQLLPQPERILLLRGVR